MRRLLALLALLALAGGAQAASSETILLGVTAPLTGASSASAAAARGAAAYFEYVNARGGVHGRSIEYTVADEGSDPAQALEAMVGLVEEDEVLAIVDPLGIERNPAARDYLRVRKVPQLFATGFRPRNEAEGWIYGSYLARTRPDARIGVLYQNDAAGQELVAGLTRGFAAAKSKVVATSSYAPGDTDIQSQLAELKASGANVLALFTTPRLAQQAFAFAARLGWRPQLVVGAASGATAVDGTISISSIKDPGDVKWRDDPAIRLYRSIMAKHATGANARDVLHAYGMAAAYEAVRVLKAAGESPTRATVTAQARKVRDASNPFLLPGITVATSSVDRFPVEQAQLRRWSQGRWRSFGGLWADRGR